MPRKQIPHHPVLATLTAENLPGKPQPEAVVKLSGYVGPASGPGLVRLYTALDDLSYYLEFEEDAVVHTMNTPGLEMPDEACSLWIKASSPVRGIREYPRAGLLIADLKNSMVPAGSPGDGAAGLSQTVP